MIKPGMLVKLGEHRLFCGDAGDRGDVAKLFGNAKPDLVFTSPPYLQQRTYVNGVGNWDTLMQRVFGSLPTHKKTQVLVNLGLMHRQGEWVPYWDGWIEWMRTQGWRRFGWYVWSKQSGMPGVFGGRPAPAHEFIFHFNREAASINKTMPSKYAGQKSGTRARLTVNGPQKAAPVTIAALKIMDSVIRVNADRHSKTGHPAVFPVALPAEIIKAYTQPGELVYDPFAGSGTTILAAKQEGRVCYAMELEPSYCDTILKRWEQHQAKGTERKACV